jgi:hydroxymethylbilane synthase
VGVAGRLRIATRASALARWQADAVAALLRAAHPGLEVVLELTSTTGDRRTDVPIHQLGGQGVFVKEVQAAVLHGRADLAVHSAKDLPSITAPGLDLAAIPPRADPRDALVGTGWTALAPGATVATGSVRRRAQLAWLRPDLRFTGLRGNIATRLEKCPPGGAVVVAAAALDRLGLGSSAATVFTTDELLPQVGQGAMAVECRAGDEDVRSLLAPLDDPLARVAVEAERSWLGRLGTGCDLPVGAYARVGGTGPAGGAGPSGGDAPGGGGPVLTLEAMIASLDGRMLLRDAISGPADDRLALAGALADRLLHHHGGAALLGPAGGGVGGGGAAGGTATGPSGAPA